MYACSTFEEEPIGPSTEAGADTGPDAGGDATIDGSPEGAASDADTSLDAGVYFFDDFDDGGRSSEWKDFLDPSGSDAGEILVEASGLSAPNALHVTNRATPFAGGLLWVWPAAAAQDRLQMEIDVNVVKRPANNAFLLKTVIDGNTDHQRDDSPAPVLVLSPDPQNVNNARLSAWNLTDTDTGVGVSLGTFTPGTWTHVVMTYGLDPADTGAPRKWRVTWAIGNPPVVKFSGSVAPPTVISASRSTFIGIQSGSLQGDVRFDNVKIDLR